MATGPRGEHDREAFTALVIGAAEAIATAEGLRGLGMRRIAAAIGYAPNSIYHAVGGLDAIVLKVNARTLDRLRRHLGAPDALGAPDEPGRDPAAAVLRLADRYLAFVASEPKLWSLLFEHRLPDGTDFPDWYAATLAEATGLVEAALRPIVADEDRRRRAVVALWAALHGIASLSMSNKLAAVTAEEPRALARLLVGGFLAGIGAEHDGNG